MPKFVPRILMGSSYSTQTFPLEAALRDCVSLGLFNESDIEKKTLKDIRNARWSSMEFIAWGRGDDLPPETKVIFIMSCHPLQLDNPPAWNHLKHLADMMAELRGNYLYYKICCIRIT